MFLKLNLVLCVKQLDLNIYNIKRLDTVRKVLYIKLLVYDVSNDGFLCVEQVNFSACADPEGQGVQVSIQCWAIIGLPAKGHLNGVLLVGL